MSVRAEILAAAAQAVTVEITPEQVAILLVDLKTVRAWGNPDHFDNWVDIAGYAACGAEVAQQRLDDVPSAFRF